MRSSVRLFSVAGIEIGIHVSWLVIFFLVTWSLAAGFLPRLLPDEDQLTLWVLAVIAALLLFASVLVHELAHSLVARAQGLEARSITLFLFGGVSNLSAESPRPGVEFLVAVVGPITSFVLAGLAYVGFVLVEGNPPVAAVLVYLALINALLGGFNLIPGFPLDGGRVLRSIVWQATGSLRRATEIAAGVGQLVAWGFLIWGFLRVIAGDFLGGIWIAAIGWFLQSAAGASVEQVRVEQVLRGTPVARMLRPDPRSVSPSTSVAELIELHLLPLNRRAMPVTDGDRLVGIVTIGDIREVPADRRPTTTVGEVMGGRDGLAAVTPRDSLARALELLGEGDYEQIPIVEDGRLAGMLTRADVLRQFQLRDTLGVGER